MWPQEKKSKTTWIPLLTHYWTLGLYQQIEDYSYICWGYKLITRDILQKFSCSFRKSGENRHIPTSAFSIVTSIDHTKLTQKFKDCHHNSHRTKIYGRKSNWTDALPQSTQWCLDRQHNNPVWFNSFRRRAVGDTSFGRRPKDQECRE